MSRSSRSHFTKGVFNCSACGRSTRGTADSAMSDFPMCEEDYELAGWYNSMQDGNLDAEGAEAVRHYIARIIEKGGTPDGDAEELLEYIEENEL